MTPSYPYPTYHHLRDQSPLNYIFLPAGAVTGLNEPIRGWALMKYDDVYNALRDHDTFVSGRNPLVGKLLPKAVLIQDDPPRHTRFRRLVNKAFTLKRIEALTPWITSVVTELLDEMGTTEAAG
jgi:cytochrome P450